MADLAEIRNLAIAKEQLIINKSISTLVINKSHKAVNMSFVPYKMVLFMEDGREISFPLAWFPAWPMPRPTN